MCAINQCREDLFICLASLQINIFKLAKTKVFQTVHHDPVEGHGSGWELRRQELKQLLASISPSPTEVGGGGDGLPGERQGTDWFNPY